MTHSYPSQNPDDNTALETLDRGIDWGWLPEATERLIERALEIQQIPAPTFAEKTRADFVKTQFQQAGLQNIESDERFNVYGLLPGTTPGPGLMVSAHLDTVFPAETPLDTRREGDRLYGPGLGDNSLGVAAIIGLVHALKHAGITPPCDLWIVATSREEGLGDLGGIRWAYERVRPRIKAVVNIEGMSLGIVCHAGIAVKRLKITATTGGGHSWGHFGRPSAIHSLVNLGARITGIHPPTAPRTTYNIGLIEGGHSINSIAASAALWLDMRSEAQKHLRDLEETVRGYIEEFSDEGVTFSVEVVGNRPAGAIAPNHALVRLAVAGLRQVGQEVILQTGSTDGNIPLSEGCPTVTIGVTTGSNAHRTDEYIDLSPIGDGFRQIVLTTLAAAQTVF